MGWTPLLSKIRQLPKMATYGIKATMISPTTEEAVKEAAKILRDLVEPSLKPEAAEAISMGVPVESGLVADAIIEFDGTTFILEYKKAGNISSVEQGIKHLLNVTGQEDERFKLLVVPYMSKHGDERCRSANISWLDLSGNAEIAERGIRVSIHGRENLFKTPGRPRNPFAPKSSRIARALLYGGKSEYLQTELVEITHLDKGHVSRIVRSLEADGLIDRSDDGSIRARNREVLLDSWREEYDFSKHSIARGYIATRTGLSLARRICEWFDAEGIRYALTGLPSAWLYTRFSDFRTVTLFIEAPLGNIAQRDLGFVERDSGANTWFVIPKENSVFWETRRIDDLITVHPIQTYLDLKSQPERADDAATEMRRLLVSKFEIG